MATTTRSLRFPIWFIGLSVTLLSPPLPAGAYGTLPSMVYAMSPIPIQESKMLLQWTWILVWTTLVAFRQALSFAKSLTQAPLVILTLIGCLTHMATQILSVFPIQIFTLHLGLSTRLLPCRSLGSELFTVTVVA